MSKISFVSGSLHSISGQISEAASRMHNPQDAAENGPEETVRTEPESVSVPPAPVADSAARNAYLKPRYEELLRMKRDLSAQLHEAEARFSAEQARFEAVAEERGKTAAELRAILSRLENCRIPDFPDPDFKPALNEALRTFENGRIELIRATALRPGTETVPAASPAKTDLSALTAGELMKKGFAFFLPLIVTILLASLLLSLAFIIAWKVAL